MLIEVSDSSEDYDRNTKLPLYAHYHISEVWLINVKQKQLEIYQKPSTDNYRLSLRWGDENQGFYPILHIP
ncbi:MAG: hypothetical protein GQ569_06505 [Methylococcaceae bacterium]|nr:hypothetical protein [Methylococcaceae bacterium]